jgi:PAS domain S-box-containing protein
MDRSRVLRFATPYGVATALVIVATLLRLPAERVLEGRAPYGLYFPVIVAVAWLFGVWPTVFASLLSLAAAWFFFLSPEFSLAAANSGDRASVVLFLVTAGVLVALARWAARTRRALGQLAAIVRYSDDAIITKDLDGTIRTWNAGAQRIFGYRAEETAGKPIWMLIPPERRDEEEQILSRLRRGERVEHFETVRIAKNGERLEVSLTISPILDASGAVIGASKIARTIGERRRAERALAEQREWFRVTLSSIGDAVITTDRAGNVSFLNPMAERLTGYTSTEAIGQPLARVFNIVNERTREPVESPADEVLRTGTIIGMANHTSLIARDGTEHPIEDSAAPIVDDELKTIGVVLVFHDVSERRRAENARQEAERDRDQLLASERAARGDAERANRVKDDFVAALSHELRTPLNAILGWTQLLRRKSQDPATLERGLSVIERNTQLQAQLISDLLDISRIMSGKLRLESQAVELATVIDAAVEAARPMADGKRIVIRRNLDGRAAPVPGDPGRLQQVVSNLLTNAIKFSPEGSAVSVALVQEDSHATITVSDTGIGIKADFVPFLFERFRQADSSITRRYGGLGLGLPIVKQLTELHGGSVAAHSAGEGQGATFTVRLPLGVPRANATPAPDRAPDGPGRPSSTEVRIEGVRVLLVEDEPDTRDLMERLLAEAGCQVVAVASAAAAIDSLRTARPDILVSDIGLPDEDGYSLMKRVRQVPASDGGNIPAIAVTAFARAEDRLRALQSGFQAHVSKPVDPAALLASIASLAQTRRPERADPAPELAR